MRGYFGVGVEEISKEGNVGNLVRSAHAFGASFFFSVAPDVNIKAMRTSDTSGAFDHVPYYQYGSVAEMDLPMECQLVGVEFIEDSIELPTFRHPTRAAERRPRNGHAFGLFRAPGRGLDQRNLRHSASSGADPEGRRRHRLLLLALAS